ncbi:hypothetical protein MRX96_040767 [Rhipicephalus microplus]
MNARPITPISSDPEDPAILTPATLLSHKKGCASPTTGEIDTTNLYKRHWHQVQNMANQFWKRWCLTYLATLQERRKWQVRKKDIREGDVVLIRDKEANHNDWPIGVVTHSLPSADGMVRKVEVEIARNGAIRKLCRSISEVVPLFSPSTNCGV